jgi:hypothetical protein
MGMSQANGSNRKKGESRRGKAADSCLAKFVGQIDVLRFQQTDSDSPGSFYYRTQSRSGKLPSGATEALRLRQHIGIKLSGLPSVRRAHLVCR